jgi:hypothetical protein
MSKRVLGRDGLELRSLLQVLLSVDIGFAGMSAILGASQAISLPFAHLEVLVNELLRIRQTDFIRGYFQVWIPSAVLALLIWILLRHSRHASFAMEILPSVAGVAIVICPSAIWFCAYERNGWSLQWPYKMVLSEPVLAVLCVWAFLKWPWDISRWVGTSAFTAHTLFWYWFTSDGFKPLNWGIPGYAGPFGLLLSVCSLLGASTFAN